jgi:hypothetical protein
MCLEIYDCYARGSFSSVGYCSHGVFSMPPEGSATGFICQGEAFSWRFARLAVSLCGALGCLDAVLVCVNIGFLLRGTVGYGEC